MKFFQIEWECRKGFRNVLKYNYTIAQENLWQSLILPKNFFQVLHGIRHFVISGSYFRNKNASLTMFHQTERSPLGRCLEKIHKVNNKAVQPSSKEQQQKQGSDHLQVTLLLSLWGKQLNREVWHGCRGQDCAFDFARSQRVMSHVWRTAGPWARAWTIPTMHSSAHAQERTNFIISHSGLMVPTRRILITCVLFWILSMY